MTSRRILAAIAITIAGTATLYQASEYWERAFAARRSSVLSPDGCIRVDTYGPLWVLPSVLHRAPDPDPAVRSRLGTRWILPTFRRAYEARTGELLGETVIYDPPQAFNGFYWGDARKPGRRVVESNGFPLVDSDRCSDEATLAKLEAFYSEEQKAIWPDDPAAMAKPSQRWGEAP